MFVKNVSEQFHKQLAFNYNLHMISLFQKTITFSGEILGI